MMKWILYCVVGALPALASAQPAEHNGYRIYDTRSQLEISLPRLAAVLQEATVIFFGEEHNDSVAHALQYELLKALDEQYEGVALSMEMLVSEDQLVLDEYLSGLVTEHNLMKDAALWANYQDYRPMITYAKENHIRVLAANAPARYTNRVTREGLESLRPLDKAAKALLAPLPIDTLEGRYYEKFAELLGGHGAMGRMKIYQSQNLWDATMAYRISKFSKERFIKKILHLTGRFHSDEKLGTVAHLRNYAPRLRLATISCFPAEISGRPAWHNYEHLADFIILTDPAADRTF